MSKLIVFLITSCVYIFVSFPVLAQDTSADISNRINELQKKISELQGAENSLSKQISIINSEINLTTLKIGTTQQQIDKLSAEINIMEKEISRLEDLLTKHSQLVVKRIPASYKRQTTLSPLMLLITSKNFSEFVSRAKYLTAIQEDDVHLLFQLKATQNHFGERKNLREVKKNEQEQLRVDLVAQQKDLDEKKQQKQALLDQTKNSEVEYQRLLSVALAERQAIDKALIEGIKVGAVKRGDPIALVGNTGYPGCSTGAHLHFEIRKNGSWTSPIQFLESKSVTDQQNGGTVPLGSGDWAWPLSDPITVTQHYGKTPYSWRYAYSGGIHTGMDMVSPGSIVIRAPKDGTLYSSSQSCGSSSIIKIKYIDHGDGLVSFYLHVQ